MIEDKINRILYDFNKRYSKDLKTMLIKRFPVLSEDEIEDIMQEAQIVLWRSIVEEKLNEKLYPYFFKTCNNLCLKAVRTKERHPESKIQDDEEDFQNDGISMNKVAMILQETDEDETNWQMQTNRLLQVLEEMTLRCQQLIRYFHLENMSWKTVAEMTGLKNAQTAKAAGSRCMQTLKEKFNR